jgi:tetratricopeptide (TPR) repeat protein
VGSRDIDIPPGEPRHQISGSYELPIDVDAYFAFPHAQSLCREILLTAFTPLGDQKTLIAIRRFDENWHDTYRFASPVRLPKGSRLVTRFTYDNSAANVRNPNNPPQRVVYGSNADDEMSDVYLQVNPVDPAQLAVLAEHYRQSELTSKIIGYRKTLDLHPDDAWSIEALASCYQASSQSEEAVRVLEARPELLRKSTQANVILGLACLAQGDAEACEKRLRRALEMDQENAVAWLGLGQALVARSERHGAERAFRRAIELAPRLTVARLDLADLLVEQARLDEAKTLCTQAIEIDATDYKPYLKLANILAQQSQYEKGLTFFARARELAPFLYAPRASLAIACYQFGDETTAKQLLHEARANDAADPVPYCFLGQIARRDGDLDQARDYLQRAAELPTPSSWPASHKWQFLELVYKEQLQLAEQLQDDALARRAALDWLKFDPSNKTLRDLLRRLGSEESQN